MICIKKTIELIMAGTIPVIILVIFIRSYLFMKKASEQPNNSKLNVGGIGARMIQFATVALLIPFLTILGLEEVLKGETIGTIIGGLVGYILSGISKYDEK